MSSLYRNIANLVVVVRTIFALAVVYLLSQPVAGLRVAGFWLLLTAALLDGVDGILARRLGIVSGIGSKMDTLGDRITENVLLIFLAVAGLLSLWIPVIFVTRSFLADFIRSLHEQRGVSGTFAMNTSKIGSLLVASKTSRTLYLMLKFAVFLGGAFYLVLEAGGKMPFAPEDMATFKDLIAWGGAAAAAINVLRFIALVYDSRLILKEEFGL